MATTSPDNLRTPDLGDPYNVTADLKVLADTTQAALSALGIRNVSSDVERDAIYPNPVAGNKVYRLDQNFLDVYIAGFGWRPGHWGLAKVARPYAVHNLRRSDGALQYNNGSTGLRWQGSPAVNTLGLTFGSDTNGAYFTVPVAGLYKVSAEFLLDGPPGSNWTSAQVSGGEALSNIYNEAAWTGGYATATVTSDLQLTTSTRVWFPFVSNNVGNFRSNATVRVYGIY